MSLKDKVVLITGASQGIGLATAKLFIQEGARVVISDIKPFEDARAELSTVVPAGSTLDDVLLAVHCDVADEESTKQMCEAAMKRFGRVDSAVANAAYMPPLIDWLESDTAQLDRTLAINVKGPWLTAKYAVKTMLASPSKGKDCTLVFISSCAGMQGFPTMGMYCSSKFGIRGVALTAAQEFIKYGIRSNVIMPGLVDTAQPRSTGEANMDLHRQANTMKRAAEPRELAEAVLYFASDKSSFCNGSSLAVHAAQLPT